MVSSETKHQVRRLYEMGHPVLEIAQFLKISPQAVYAHLARQGLTAPTKRGG